MDDQSSSTQIVSVPFFGVRKFAKGLATDLVATCAENERLREQLAKLAGMTDRLIAEYNSAKEGRDLAMRQIEDLGLSDALQLKIQQQSLEREVAEQRAILKREKAALAAEFQATRLEMQKAHAAIAATDDLIVLQEAGVYQYRHPLQDIVGYEAALENINYQIKSMIKKDGGAVLATTDWTVNGSISEGRSMVRDFSKLMLRAFNAEADNLVRNLKPHKLSSAIDKLTKVSSVIERLSRAMHIRISPEYFELRCYELELTADYLQKLEETKDIERAERERLREERKAQQEIERERERLEKERQHYANARQALVDKGDELAARRMAEQLAEVEKELANVDFRAANIRAGYVYVISNIGSFGERMVKVGMTRRLDPMERIRELSDASVPFNFDVHALFFSKDAVQIETALHQRLAGSRVNLINQRREFFRISPVEVKAILAELAGDLLQFQEIPEALEYRQCLQQQAV
jgi:hypothetical protein